MNRLPRLTLMFAAFAFAVALGALGLNRGSSPASAITAPALVSEPIPMLPTIVVNARTEMPTLPLVVVRPSAEELLAAADQSGDRELLVASSTGSESIADLLPRARLDMPYYSFGKTLPRASKE